MSATVIVPPLTPEALRIVATLRHRLALGIEVLDAVSGLAAFGPPVVELERIGAYVVPPETRRLTGAPGSARFARAWVGPVRRLMALAAARGEPGDWVIRLHGDPLSSRPGGWDPRREARRFVPRRLRLRPVIEAEGGVPVIAGQPAPNARRCALLPGAAYPLPGGVTAIRGRVMDDATRPMPWARLRATVPAEEADPDLARPVGRAAADEKGEFVLVIGPDAVAGAALPAAARIRLWAHGPAAPPAPDPEDALAGLPIEDAGTEADGPLLRGATIPAGFTRGPATRVVEVRLSTTLSGPVTTLILP